jgi:transposase
MIPVPSGVRVWLAVGRTDMRRGMNGLALQVQEALGRDPHAGDPGNNPEAAWPGRHAR